MWLDWDVKLDLNVNVMACAEIALSIQCIRGPNKASGKI